MKDAKVVFALLIVIISGTWFGVFHNVTAKESTFHELVQSAEKFEKKKIYVDAAEYYKKALELSPEDFQLTMKYAYMNEFMGNETAFLQYCAKASQLDTDSVEPYLAQANHFLSKQKISRAIAVLKQSANVADRSEISTMLDSLRGKYMKLYASFDDINNWYEDTATVQENGKWGLITSEGNRKILSQFDQINGFDEEEAVMPVSLLGEWYYIDRTGQRKLVGDDTFEELGVFSEGVAPAKLDGKYGYIDRNFKKHMFEYDYVSAMKNGVAAVKNSEGKWALINKQFEPTTEFIYDDVIIDQNGFCTQFNAIFVQKDEYYILVDLKGNQLGTQRMAIAKPFAANEYAAVKVDDKWGFISQKGIMMIQPQYDNANSFSTGLAGVLVDDKWGFINPDNKMIIEPTFANAKLFSKDGVAPVQFKSDSKWQLIQLLEYRQ